MHRNDWTYRIHKSKITNKFYILKAFEDPYVIGSTNLWHKGKGEWVYSTTLAFIDKAAHFDTLEECENFLVSLEK